MDIIEWSLRTWEKINRDGLSLSNIIYIVLTLYNISVIKALVRRRLPKRLRYKDRLERVEGTVNAIAKHMGVQEWDVQSKVSSTLPNDMNSKKKSLLSWLAVPFRVRFIGASTMQTDRSNHFKIREGFIPMKKKLLSRKFLIALATGLLIILNDGLEMGLDTETIMYVVGIVGIWIFGEAAVDISGKEKSGVSAYDAKTLDAVRQDSEGA